jgi:hypothetical protein
MCVQIPCSICGANRYVDFASGPGAPPVLCYHQWTIKIGSYSGTDFAAQGKRGRGKFSGISVVETDIT